MYVKCDHINVNLRHDEAVQIFSHDQSGQNSQPRQNQVLPEHITRRLVPVKAEHLNRRDFPKPFGDIDIRQVVQHDEGERAGTDDDHKHHIVHAFHHAAKTGAHVFIGRHAGNSVAVHDGCGGLVNILSLLHIYIGGLIFRLLSGLCRPGFRRKIRIIIDIVFTDSGNRNRQAVPILILQNRFIAHAQSALFRELRGEHRFPFSRPGNGLSAFRMKIQISPHFLRFLRHDKRYGLRFILMQQIGALFIGNGISFRNLSHDLLVFRPILLRIGIAEGHIEIVDLDFPILIIDDAADGILDAEPRQQQGRTAADSEHHHEKTLFITKNVSCRYLDQKRHMIP